jgi:hypothetical protein
MLYFIEYVLSGWIYLLYCLFCIICALACLGYINEIEEKRELLIFKKRKELLANQNSNIEAKVEYKTENLEANNIFASMEKEEVKKDMKQNMFQVDETPVINQLDENDPSNIVNKTSDGYIVFDEKEIK